MEKFKDIQNVLKDNYYIGRGIVCGLSEDGNYIFLGYILSGRSENSKNRKLIKRGQDLTTSVFDESKVEDPSLIIYTAMKRYKNYLILTNGNQTDTIYEKMSKNLPFEHSLNESFYEPDPPIYTPRISLVVDFDSNSYKMSILKNGNVDTGKCDRHFFGYEFDKGRGHFIRTYDTTKNELEIFNTLPEVVNIENDFLEFSDRIWDNLNPENKIALYTCFISKIDGTSNEKIYNIH